MSSAEHPRELRLLCAGNNWTRLGALIACGMSGYRSTLPKGSRVSVVTAEPGSSATDAGFLVEAGEFDIAVTTPTFYGTMAHKGIGLFDSPSNLRAIARLPHDDRLVIAVRSETGITSIEEIAEKRIPLRISTPLPSTRHPVCWVLDRVLAGYGTSLSHFEAWGSVLLDDRPRDIANDPHPVDPSFQCIIDEAIMTPRWGRIFSKYDMNVLGIREDVLASMEHSGFRRGVIHAGRLPGLTRSVDTVDMSGWLIICREDLPDQIVRAFLGGLLEQSAAIQRMIPPENGLTADIKLGEICTDTGAPLHSAAVGFFAEHNAL